MAACSSTAHGLTGAGSAPRWVWVSAGNADCGRRMLVAAKARGKAFGELLRRSRGQHVDAEEKKTPVPEPPEQQDLCPCGSKAEYNACCGIFHRGESIEPDAATVMRARYSAYARGVVPYVVSTTHKNNPEFKGEQRLAADVKYTCNRLRFQRLDILDAEEISENEACVSFKVTYSSSRGDRKVLLEKSKFSRDSGGRWLYLEAIPLDQASKAAST